MRWIQHLHPGAHPKTATYAQTAGMLLCISLAKVSHRIDIATIFWHAQILGRSQKMVIQTLLYKSWPAVAQSLHLSGKK